jgi:hypothetical protein
MMPVHQAGFYTKTNLDKLREAKSKGQSVGVLSLGRYIKGKVKSIIWDDQNDIVKVATDDKKTMSIIEDQIALVNILDG